MWKIFSEKKTRDFSIKPMEIKMKRKKALKKLETRVKDYEITKQNDPNGGRGFHKPGSMK